MEQLLAVADPAINLPKMERREAIMERDGAECVWCRVPLAVDDYRFTVEHVLPRAKGGPTWPENEVTACSNCNKTRGAKMPLRFIKECKERGLEPNEEVIIGCLLRLEVAIGERGGCRRARPKLQHQLRRLQKIA